MHVTSACPLRVASFLWQPRVDALALTVVCKATFALAPGRSSLAPIQEEPLQADLLHEDGVLGSLRLASDLVPFKRRVDVIVTGHAYAPHGPPVTSLVARVALGAVDKRIEVHGDRWWTADGQLTAPVPFIFMPLRWERAAAGPGTWNAAGVPAGAVPDARGLRPAPNLVLPGEELWSPEEVIASAGFGPIAPTWLERAARLRRHAATWRHDAWSATPMPEDIDAAYFNVAPPDQQLDQLHPGEQLVLEHLHREHPQLVTLLDEVVPFAAVERAGAARQEIRLRCDTVCIETDRGICTLTWRGVVPLRDAGEEGVVVVTADIPAMAEEETATAVRPRGTLTPEEVLPFVKAEVLPFVPAPEGGGGAAGAGRTVGQVAIAYAEAETPARAADEGTGTLAPRLSMIGAEPLPFHPAARGEDVAPPPMSWAPATPEVLKAQPAAETDAEERTASEPSETAHANEETLFERYPIERCAAIAVRIACEASSTGEILRAEGLDPEQWQRAHAHWLDRIADSGARDRKRMLSDYDRAYVGELEARRGRISLEEYARLAEAAERGAAASALAERGLPEGAWPHLHRLWIGRLVKDVRLGREVRRKVEEAREAAGY